MSSATTHHEPSRGPIAVLAIGAVFALALLTEVPYVNGPEYSRWLYRTLPLDRAFALFAGPLILYAYLLHRYVLTRAAWSARHARFIVGGLVVCSIMFQYASLHVDKRGRNLLTEIVTNQGATGYFSNAAEISDARAFLQGFASAKLHTHSKTHPPGPILFYYGFIQLVGIERAPWLAGICIGLLASLGVAVLYGFTRLWAEAGSARVVPCFVYCLCPALIGFFPEFDQVYPIVAMAMMLTWERALHQPRFGVWLGLTLFVASFTAYNLVTFGAFMAPYTVWWLHRRSWQRQDLVRCASAAAIALATALAVHVLLWAATSYHAIDSFRSALHAQAHFSRHNRRPYEAVIFSDPVDFFLGGGLVTLPLMLLYLRSQPEHTSRSLTVIAILALAIVNFSGLLRCETARVWLFLQPLAAVPAGLELARWNDRDRALALGLLALIVIVVRCKLRFIL
jgi:hypothetical protein